MPTNVRLCVVVKTNTLQSRIVMLGLILSAGLIYAQARQELCLLKPGTLAAPWRAGRKQAS